MTLVPPLQPPAPGAANPDGFKTTMEMGEFIKEHRCKSAAPGAPFFMLARFVDHPAGRWPTVETKGFLGLFSNAAESVSVRRDTLTLAAARFVPMQANARFIDGELTIRLGDFLHTQLRGPFLPPPGSLDPRGHLDAVTFAATLPDIEKLVLAERQRIEGIGAWYLSAIRLLGWPVESTNMHEAAETIAAEAVGKLVKAHALAVVLRDRIERPRVIHDAQDAALALIGSRDRLRQLERGIRRLLIHVRRLGLGERSLPVAIDGVRYVPQMFIEDLSDLYPPDP